jgi:hypothetical protein
LEEIVIAGDDDFGLVLSCQIDHIVIIRISAQSRPGFRVRLDICSSREPRQVHLGRWDRDPSPKPRPFGEDIVHLVQQTPTHDQFEGLCG